MRAGLLVVLLAFGAALGCGASMHAARPAALGDLRSAGFASKDGELVGRWVLAEEFSPGGTAEQAAAARKRLDAKTVSHQGPWAAFARAVFDEAHGDPRSAAAAYVVTLGAAAVDTDPQAPLLAWFAARQLLSAPRVRGGSLRAEPRHARRFARSPRSSRLADGRGARRLARVRGLRQCREDARVRTTRTSSTAWAARAESESPVPSAREAHRTRWAFLPAGAAPSGRSRSGSGSIAWHDSARSRRDPVPGALAEADEQANDGVYYVESFFTTRGDRELIAAVQGKRRGGLDRRHAGSLEGTARVRGRGNVSVRMSPFRTAAIGWWPGRLRLRRAFESSIPMGRRLASKQMVTRDFRPRSIRRTFLTTRTRSTPSQKLSPGGRLHCRGPAPFRTRSARRAGRSDGRCGVGADRPARRSRRTRPPLALEMAATFVEGDPAFPEDARAPRARAFRRRALARDESLRRARRMSIVDDAEQLGPGVAVDAMRALADRMRGEPEVLEHLALLYGRLGWHGDRMRALADLAQRFPDDVAALHAYLEALDEEGPAAESDKVAARIKKLDPDAEVDLDRALARHDYKAAIAELGRLKQRRPDRKEMTTRIADVLARSGDPSGRGRRSRESPRQTPGARRGGSVSPGRSRIRQRGDTAALRFARWLPRCRPGRRVTICAPRLICTRGRPTWNRTARTAAASFASFKRGRRPVIIWTARPRASSTTPRSGCTTTARARCSSTRYRSSNRKRPSTLSPRPSRRRGSCSGCGSSSLTAACSNPSPSRGSPR